MVDKQYFKMTWIWSLIHWLIDSFIRLFSSQSNNEISLEELTISDIHNAYKEGRYTSQQLVLAYQERIRQFDDSVNSITFINDDALGLAKELDDEFKKTGVLRPLHGIPIIIKDNINVTGIPTTAGSLALQNYMPAENAFVIWRADAGS